MTKRRLLMIGAALLGIAVALLVTLDRLKQNPAFCVSCHLPNGNTLHAEKARRFRELPPGNLAALHRAKEAAFTCVSCHNGGTRWINFPLWLAEAGNTLKYFLGDYQEPEKFRTELMPDGTCTPCHGNMGGGRYRFHGAPAHLPRVDVRCVSCHAAHGAGDTAYYFINRAKMEAACAKCHKRIPGLFEGKRG